jgi:hypothetical protein
MRCTFNTKMAASVVFAGGVLFGLVACGTAPEERASDANEHLGEKSLAWGGSEVTYKTWEGLGRFGGLFCQGHLPPNPTSGEACK